MRTVQFERTSWQPSKRRASNTTTYRFAYVPEPGKIRTRSFKALEGLKKSALKVLGTSKPRFDGDYFVGPDGTCMVPCHTLEPKDVFPELFTGFLG